ncbi:MAG TPA: hypothetical protein VMI06_10470 [Terriglobia bacterium]|nr:hypothetical protein [Terriglobia bacterium]
MSQLLLHQVFCCPGKRRRPLLRSASFANLALLVGAIIWMERALTGDLRRYGALRNVD